MPAPLISRTVPGNKGFLRALLTAITFLILSAAILIAGFLAWHYPQLTAGANIKPVSINVNNLFIGLGKGNRQDSKLIVEELIEDGTAVISSRRIRLNASSYPILEYKITGRNPGTDVVLYWRTTTHNHQTLFAKLHWNSDYKAAYKLQNHPEWKGKITELGISIAGDLRNEPINIEQLTFSPLTVKSLLLTVWSEWNAFEGWTQSSINVIRGMPENALISPVAGAAAWCGLAILMYSLKIVRTSVNRRDALLSVDRDQPENSTWNVTKRIWDPRSVVAMFLIAWLALDGKWQINLWRQLSDTKYLYAGKTHPEQHMATDDAKLYAYAKKLKEDVLPQEPVRLFILRNKWRDRTRLKLMYYLLPHNIYNFGPSPNPKLLKDGDYILAINPLKDLSYSAPDEMLKYSKNRAIRVESLDQNPLGSVFIVRNSEIVLEIFKINHYWNKDSLSGRLMRNPVVIAGVPTNNGPDPGVVALGNHNNGRLQLRFQEWDYRDDQHTTERTSILALDQGTHRMPDGSVWETGIINLGTTDNWETVEFNNVFPAAPSLFLSTQTSSPQTAISVRAKNISANKFDVRADTQESKKDQSTSTTIAYLAIYSASNHGTLSIEGKQAPYQLKQASISTSWQSFEGFDLRLQEEQSLDKEIDHSAENVDILVLNNHVFAQIVSDNEQDTISIRMRMHKSNN